MYFLGVDFGGGSCKATLLSSSGKVAAEAFSEYPTQYIAGGGACQNPVDWVNSAIECIRSVLKFAAAEEIKCICFSAATHTAVLLGADGNPVCPSVYWTDTRSAPDARELNGICGDEIRLKTLHSPSPVWTIAQLRFLNRVSPKIMRNVKRVTFAKDYVRGFFTGDFVTDRIEAAGSMFYDVEKGRWDVKLCALAGISEDVLPKLNEPVDVAGTVTASAAAASGLKKGTLVITGCTDTAAEVFAAGCLKKGDASVKFATAGRICVISDKPAVNENIINYQHLKKGLWYPGSATKSCAASLRWFRDAFGGDYRTLDDAASETDAGADGLLFHPYLSGELTPYNLPSMRGAFNGVTGIHRKGHFARAVMEGAAFSMRNCLDSIRALGLDTGDTAVFLGGAAKSALWRQIAADVLNLKLIVRKNCDSSFGGAMLAGIGAGYFKNTDEAFSVCRPEEFTVYPDEKNREVYGKAFARYLKLADFYKEFYGADK